MEHLLHRADRSAGRGGHCKLCRTGAGDELLAETVRHLFVCQCPEVQGALERLVADGCTALVGAGVRVRGPCQAPPVDGCGSALPPGCRARWVRVWFDPRRLFWMEVVVRDECDVWEYNRRDPLGAVLGVLPRCLDRLLAWSRTAGHGGWVRRSLRAQGELRGQMQVLLLRGAWRVYRTRCRLMDDWWRAPAQAPDRDSLAQSAAGRAMRRARSRQKRAHDLFELKQAARRARRVARPCAAGVSCLAGSGIPASPVMGLVLTLVAETPATVVGSNAMFVLTVRNVGDSVSVGGVVSAPLPGGYGFVDVDSECYHRNSGVWTVGALGPGDSESVRLCAVLLPTGPRDFRGQVLRRSGRRRNPIDYMAPVVWSPADDPMVHLEGALYNARASLPWY